MYKIRFDAKADKVVAKWKKSNPILFNKLRKVLKDIMLHPRTGIGQCCLLKECTHRSRDMPWHVC